MAVQPIYIAELEFVISFANNERYSQVKITLSSICIVYMTFHMDNDI